jgi:hypothetical protein
MWAIFDLTPKWDHNYSFIQHNHYILITNTLISSLIPATWVHPNENFKIQQNKMVKMTYVPNKIRIPTHRVDFLHQGLGLWGRTWNRQWSRRKVSRGEGRKREREEEGRGRGTIFCGWVTPWWLARLLRESRRPTWCDLIDVRWNMPINRAIVVGSTWRHIGTGPRVYPISHASAYGVTQNGQILKISFGLIHSSIFFFKKTKLKKNAQWRVGEMDRIVLQTRVPI